MSIYEFMDGFEAGARGIHPRMIAIGDIAKISIALSLKRLADHFVPALGDAISTFENTVNDIAKDTQA